MQKTEAAMILAGVTPEEQRQASAPTNLHVITGTIAGKSENGKTRVLIDGLVFSADNSQYIEIDTLGGLQEGDMATILLTGEAGHGMTPLAVGAAGSIDRIDVRIGRIEADYVKATVLEANYATITNLDAATARIHELEVDHVTIDDFEAEQAKITNLQTATADIDTIRANSAKVQNLTAAQLEADHATIGQLDSTYATITNLNAANGRIDTLEANTADIDTIRANSAKVQNLTAAQLEADHATVGSLSSTYATITNLNAANGRIDNLQSSKANVTDLNAATGRITSLEAADVTITGRLEAAEAVIDDLDANYIHTDMLNADVAWLQNGVIKDGAIVNGMIQSVSANKLTAGTIDASDITVTNLNADNITTGTINGQRIGAGSLSLDKLEEDVYTETEVDNIVAGLQTQIDGAIETWTGTDIPTLQNAPAVNWNTNAKKDSHVGDVYFVVNSNSQQNGYNYRFTKSGNTYSWQLIKDSDVTNALARLSTAEGKITTFDSDISTLKTDTGTLKAKTTSLETRMSDAEDDILDKVDTTTFNEVSDTVDTHSRTITQMSTTLSNKADSSTVTAVTQRVSKTEQDIDGINTTIGSLQTTVESKADGSTVETISSNLNTISNTVDGHTQSIRSINSTLETKADGSTVSTLSSKVNTVSDTVDGHTQSLQSINSTLATKADSSTVSSLQQDYADFKQTTQQFESTIGTTIDQKVQYGIDNLEIGGRNLILNTAEAKTSEASANESSYTTNYTLSDYGHSIMNNTEDVWYCSFDYVISGNSNSSIEVYFQFRGSATSVDITPKPSGNASGHYGEAFKLSSSHASSTSKNCRFRMQRATDGATITITNLKLEKGNKASDWTPAPEDLESSVTSIEQRVTTAETSITQNTEAIRFKANAADVYTTTEVDGLISTEVDNRNAAINISADAINQSVSAQYVTNQRFNDLKIGGRNLLPMTETWLASRDGKTYSFQGITITQQDDGWFSVSGTRDSSVVDSSNGVISLWRNPSGDNYTEAINARIPAPNSEKLYVSVEVEGTPFLSGTVYTDSSHVALYGDVVGKNVRCGGYSELKKPLNIDSSYVSTIRYYMGINSSGTVNGRFRVKLETGDLATAWTPAPEDQEAAINSARTWYAECPTVAATAAKVATITPATTEFKLEKGVSVSVKFTYANSVASPTLNVNGTGAKAIMRYGTTAPSTSAATSWQANSINTLTYDGTYWRLNNWLNDNTTYNLGRNLHATAIEVLEAVASGLLMVGTSSGYKKIAAGVTFTLGYPILYSSAAYTANTTYTNTYETWNSVTYSSTAAIQSGAANKTIYLKGSISGNTFTIASSNVFTTVEPTSEDGFLYIPLGVMSSATVGNFVTSSTLYAYIDGKFRQVTPTEIVSTHRIYYRTATANSTLAAPSTWVAEATGNVYDAWTTKVPPMAASTEEGRTKYLYLYTCEQRKRLDGTIECTKVLLDENTTVIDGGQIITNSVTANQIAAGTITAEEIAGGTITSDNIEAGSISADRLEANALTLGNIDGLEDRLAEIDAGLSTLSNSTQWVTFQESVGTVFGEEGSANNVTVKADGVYFNTEGGEAARASAGIFYSNEVQANDSISAPIIKIGNWALIQSGTTFSIEYLG